MEIEVGETPQPANNNVGFNDTSADEADIGQAILDAEAKGTTIGEIEDAEKAAKPEETPKEEGESGEPEDSKKVEEKPDNSETPAEKEKREAQARDDAGKFRKESNYERAKKEAARKDRSWKALEEEKAATRAQVEQEKAQIAQERARISSEQARMQEQARNRGDFTPQEYHSAAQTFQSDAMKALSEGDADKARELFHNASVCTNAAQRTWEHNFMQARNKDIDETVKKHPELNDANSEASKAMLTLLQENPYLAQVPNGFSKAATFLEAQRSSARVSELEGKLKELTTARDKAIEELKAATSLAGAGSQTQPAGRSFDDLPSKEQERAVERMFTPGGEFIHG